MNRIRGEIMSASTITKTVISTAWMFLTASAATAQNLQPPIGPPDVPSTPAHSTVADKHVQQELKLGGDFLVGRGVPKDPVRSAYWYRKAADQGNPEAQAELGYFYSAGIGVQANPAEAAKWFVRAMAGGSNTAKLNLAVMYLKGRGVRRDLHLGIDLLNELAKVGDGRAEFYLGIAYYLGYGVNMDHGLAEKWFTIAAKQHRAEAQYAMGTLYSVAPDHAHDDPKAVEFLRSSAQRGYVPSMHSLGLLLVNHPALSQQPDEAITMLRSAADAGSWRSSVLLGVLARDGIGEPRDDTEAYRWFLIAARQGGSEAKRVVNFDRIQSEKKLDASSRKEQESQATTWINQHPRTDLFVFGNKMESGNFPIAEVPSLEQADTGSG
jgi:hypothetical protein